MVLLPVNVEYFVDQDRYIYWIALHCDTAMLLGAIIVFVTESTFVHFTTHACGLLEIVGDRVERVLENSILNVLHDKAYLAIHGQLVTTITLHQRILKFIECLNTSMLTHYCILIAIGVVSLSMNLYILAKAMLLMKVIVEMTIAVTWIVIYFFYMGCGNYIAQMLLDKGNDLFVKTYNARWHDAPLPVQKMLQFIRQRSMLPTALVFGGLYIGSFEFFSKLVNVSMSYFTVLYSTA
ncbi:odorant receptor Or2-like [Andrena cerasifolii]|uniref:odorant receptor Or2-like n=1 Tax=Andrena cerasifolii TaxID=2819439 RepID=UPI004037BAC5